MTSLQKRMLLSGVLDFSVMLILWNIGAGAWGLLAGALSLWAFYDGMTRCDL